MDGVGVCVGGVPRREGGSLIERTDSNLSCRISAVCGNLS